MSTIEKAMGRQVSDGPFSSVDGQSSSPRSAPAAPVQGPIHKVDLRRLEEEGLLIPEQGGHILAEEFRMIKRPLLLNAFGKTALSEPRANLVMVVSALAGEGKTFTALNLSLSIAMERDTTVLVVDSDVVKPTLSRSLGLGERPGLTDLLQEDSLSVSDVIVNTNIPKLKVLSAGRTSAHSTELLASKRMERLAEELSSRYPDRIVIFDSPPLLVTSQACVLSQQMGQILVVVEAGRTAHSAVREAIGLLDTDKAIGMVLNKKPGSFLVSDYRSYGYEYGRTEA